MALAPSLANASASAAADAVARHLDNGYCRIYSGTKPATADTALSGNTLLAELRYNVTSAPAASNGVLTMNSMTADSSADATGTATFFRALRADGTTVVFDGTVGTSGCDMNLTSTSIVVGGAVSVTAHTYTQSKS